MNSKLRQTGKTMIEGAQKIVMWPLVWLGPKPHRNPSLEKPEERETSRRGERSLRKIPPWRVPSLLLLGKRPVCVCIRF